MLKYTRQNAIAERLGDYGTQTPQSHLKHAFLNWETEKRTGKNANSCYHHTHFTHFTKQALKWYNPVPAVCHTRQYEGCTA